MRRLAVREGAAVVIPDQCQYGAEIREGPQVGMAVKKPTGFATNSACIAHELQQPGMLLELHVLSQRQLRVQR